MLTQYAANLGSILGTTMNTESGVNPWVINGVTHKQTKKKCYKMLKISREIAQELEFMFCMLGLPVQSLAWHSHD